MHRVTLAARAVLIVFAASCGGNPVRPNASESIAKLSITGPDAVFAISTANYEAVATLADGTTRTVQATWSSANPTIASVAGNGQMSALAHGSTTLTASYAGAVATKSVQVVNNYAGKWEGQYVVRTCTDSGDLTDHDGGWCAAGPGRAGTVYPLKLILLQTGSTLTEITGTLGGPSGAAITGEVTAEGRLKLRGSWNVLDWEGDLILATERIRDWETNVTAPGVMGGRWSEEYVSVYLRIGTAYMEHEITLSRQSGPWDYLQEGVGAKR